jgi:hypothetical protein
VGVITSKRQPASRWLRLLLVLVLAAVFSPVWMLFGSWLMGSLLESMFPVAYQVGGQYESSIRLRGTPVSGIAVVYPGWTPDSLLQSQGGAEWIHPQLFLLRLNITMLDGSIHSVLIDPRQIETQQLVSLRPIPPPNANELAEPTLDSQPVADEDHMIGEWMVRQGIVLEPNEAVTVLAARMVAASQLAALEGLQNESDWFDTPVLRIDELFAGLDTLLPHYGGRGTVGSGGTMTVANPGLTLFLWGVYPLLVGIVAVLVLLPGARTDPWQEAMLDPQSAAS